MILSELTADRLSTKVDELYKTVAYIATNRKLSFEEMDVAITRLERQVFAFDDVRQDIAEGLLASIPGTTKKLLVDAYCEWETDLENRFADSIVNGEASRINEYKLYDRFFHLLSKEIRLLKDHRYEKILFIGSGPFPITAILLAILTGRHVDCLDKNEQSAETSRKVLEKLGMSDKITVYAGDGSTFPVEQYDVILNALLAKPKASIMKNVRRHGKTCVRTLCRTSFGLRELIYESTPRIAVTGFDEMNRQVAGNDDTISTYLLVNKKERMQHVKAEWLNELSGTEAHLLSDMMNRIAAADNHNGFLQPLDPDGIYFSHLMQNVKDGLKHVLVIRDNDKFLGQLVLNRSLVDSLAFRAEITTLMVDPAIRGKEVSLKVAHALIGKCDELGIQYVTLDVRKGSRVEMLWKLMGFIPFGNLPCYAKVGNQEYEGIFLYQKVAVLKEQLVRKFELLYA